MNKMKYLVNHLILLGFAVTGILLSGAADAESLTVESNAGAVQLSALSGVEQLETRGDSEILIYASSGICQLRIVAGMDQTFHLHFYYALHKPFARIEGFNIMDNIQNRRLDPVELEAGRLLQQEDNRISIYTGPTDIEWTIQVIDFYR
jgi:hypothetical protein